MKFLTILCLFVAISLSGCTGGENRISNAGNANSISTPLPTPDQPAANSNTEPKIGEDNSIEKDSTDAAIEEKVGEAAPVNPPRAARDTQAQISAASVLEISGEWIVEGGNRSVSKGSSLNAGVVIRPRFPDSQTSFIVITNLNGQIIARKYCRDENACSAGVQIPMPEQPSMFTRVYGAVTGLLGSNPKKFQTVGSRDKNGELQEAVVLFENDQINLEPVFRSKPNDKYRIRFVKPPCPDVSKCEAVFGPVEFDSRDNTSLSIPKNKLVPGVYEIQLLKENEVVPAGAGTEAWVFVSAPRIYKALASSFEEMVNLTKTWESTMENMNTGDDNKKLKKTTIRSFLRAALFNLDKKNTVSDKAK